MQLMPHQEAGIQKIKQEPWVALFDKPGLGKTRMVIDGLDKVDVIVVVCPAQVKLNWIDPAWGELMRWAGARTCRVFDMAEKKWYTHPGLAQSPAWVWIVVSYEWLRKHLKEVYKLLGREAFALVLDESSKLNSHRSQQHLSCLGLRYGKIREKVGKKVRWTRVRQPASRCIILNGTPYANNYLDLWAQFQVLQKDVFDMSYWQFRCRYCIMGGYMGKKVVGYRNREEIIRKTAPYILARGKELLDLPPVRRQVVEVALTPATWSLYKELRETLVLEFKEGTVTAAQAVVKSLRLSQLTSGYIGGVIKTEAISYEKTVSQEKLDWFLTYIKDQEEPIIVWCWWRHELERVFELVRDTKRWDVYKLAGGTDKQGVHAFHPSHVAEGRQLLVAQPAAGGMGLNLAKAAVNVYLSRNASWVIRDQSAQRTDRPGQINEGLILDVLATGPKGQKTFDHVVKKALEDKEEVGTWTRSQWITALRSE